MYYNAIEFSMTEFEATLRRVGDSMGIIIPHQIIEQIQARPGEKIRVVIPGRIDWSRIWGRLQAKESTDVLIRRARTARD
jgi:antitoxin component of MazEF toxin-antitoxin module